MEESFKEELATWDDAMTHLGRGSRSNDFAAKLSRHVHLERSVRVLNLHGHRSHCGMERNNRRKKRLYKYFLSPKSIHYPHVSNLLDSSIWFERVWYLGTQEIFKHTAAKSFL